MLAVQHITKELGGRTVLADVSLVANAGRPIGIVGVNGSGKSTLLKIVAGELAADAGRTELPAGTVVGYLAQGLDMPPETPVALVFPHLYRDTAATEARLVAVSRELATATGDALTRLETEYDRLLATLGNETPAAAFDEIDLRHIDPATPIGQLSGGERTKVGLLEIAAKRPGLLLLDEPTNHLDIAGIEWLESYIARFAGAVIIVSHDRALLDACVHEVVELDGRSGKAEVYTGGYSDYANEKARRREDQWARYRLQQREEAHIKRVISNIESTTRSIENRTIDFAIRKKAAKVMRRAVTMRARLERDLVAEDRIERPDKATQAFAGSFVEDQRGRSRLLVADHLAVDIAGRRLFEGVGFEVSRGERVVLAGPNGSGKTTLLRAILGQHPVAGGLLEVAGSASVGYLPQGETLDDGDLDRTPVQLFRRDRPMTDVEANNLLHRFLFGHDRASRPLREMSYGERRRLALARLVIRGASLLLLDEPTNHLDIPSREAFETALDGFEGGVLVVTHDRYFIDRFAHTIVELS